MTAKADVGRSTYFRYFKSKDEVLSFKITCLWKRFSDEHGATNFATGSYDGIRLFLNFAFPFVLFVICSTQLIANM